MAHRLPALAVRTMPAVPALELRESAQEAVASVVSVVVAHLPAVRWESAAIFWEVIPAEPVVPASRTLPVTQAGQELEELQAVD